MYIAINKIVQNREREGKRREVKDGGSDARMQIHYRMLPLLAPYNRMSQTEN